MSFEPIAIVGRGCVLPEALDPQAFWHNVADGRRSLSQAPAGRWGLSAKSVVGGAQSVGSGVAGPPAERTWHAVGGYVHGFEERFDPQGFLVGAEDIRAMDPQVHWLLHAAREALNEAGRAVGDTQGARTGLITGNLSFPTAAMARFAESVWLDNAPEGLRKLLAPQATRRPDPRNRFSSGMPARFAARALGLGAGAFALDAACASSLYAIKLACDRLHDRSADLMLAGAVNCPDDLFIHMGFTALSAMSPTGRSRPFHRHADGLVPAEGAGFVVLTRLADAIAADERVLGVIRGVGLSNDGRTSGLLVPARSGQERAMERAYLAAGIAPETVSLIECHATGTAVGDATEVESMLRIFGHAPDLPMGSAKSNVGHLVTSAGIAGLLKILGAMEAGVRPATLGADEPLAALAGTPLRILHTSEEWSGPRRAALSAFGFGGNNAHLIVDAWQESGTPLATPPSPRAPTDSTARTGPADRNGADADADTGADAGPMPIAVVAVAVRSGAGRRTDDFRSALFGAADVERTASDIEVALTGLRFPPVDLAAALPQQLLLLETAREAAEGLSLPPDRTGVLIGMGADAEVARYGARWRSRSWIEGGLAGEEDLTRLADAFQGPLTAAGVLGTMPNLVANRVNTQLDLRGMGFTVSAEEESGVTALRLSVHALRAGELDAAVVGAVDLSDEPVHRAALAGLGVAREPGDAAVVLVLKPLAGARRDGDRVLALVDGAEGPARLLIGDVEGTGAGCEPTTQATVSSRRSGQARPDRLELSPRFGHAHAAHGLLAVAATVLALCHRAVPRQAAPADPSLGPLTARAVVTPVEGPTVQIRLHSADPAPWVEAPAPRPRVFSGADTTTVLDALAVRRESSRGPARLVLLSDDDGLAALAEEARRWLTSGGPRPAGAFFRSAPIAGETAFVYSGGSMAYSGMGRRLMLAFPDVIDRLAHRTGDLQSEVGWAYGGHGPGHPGAVDQIWGASLLAQLHTEITRGELGITPHAVLGYSSGETTALTALGLWADPAAVVRDIRGSDLFTEKLTGAHTVMRRAWSEAGRPGRRWASHMVNAPVDDVRRALRPEPTVHLVTINSPDSCVIGGEEDACRRVLGKLAPAPSLPVLYDVAVHVPELSAIRQEWRDLHHRPVTELPGVRFYTTATGDWYHPDTDSAADALTGMALGTVDFPAVVEKAWADGVRVFIEHGPRGLCTGWIQQILGEREHVAIALDSPGGDVHKVLLAASELLCAGVELNIDQFMERLASAAPRPAAGGPAVTFPAHPAPPELPEPAPVSAPEPARGVQVMAPAPLLPAESDAPEPAPAPAALPSVAPAALPAVAPAVPHPSAVPTGAVVRVPLAESSASSEKLSALAAVHRQAAAAHQEFLEALSQTHERFLHIRRTTRAMLARGTQDGTAPAGPVSPPHPAVDLPRPQPLPAAAPAPLPPGPSFGRQELEHLAHGRISDLFGPGFTAQDGYRRQVRMPRPPMLLVDRVTGIDAVALSMGTGTIRTETDVSSDSWYLDPAGRMPAGIMIEAGQADLLLISWLGADLHNRGERVYRLLGCELTYHGSPPVPGETLSFDIHIDGHGEHNGVRIFFFHYDCHVDGELRLSVRDGQAGFFTDAELATTRGVLWDPAQEDPPAGGTAAPERHTPYTSFDTVRVKALTDGRLFDCFGAGWEATRAHVRTPLPGQGRMLMWDAVPVFDAKGGPWGRGYLRARRPITPEDWFFQGHFHNDPCMPGTLMFEGCLQAMAFHLTAMGFTAQRDGWRFEPVTGTPSQLRCRGQVTPDSRELCYEVFVTDVVAGPEPALVADVLCTVDGVKAFHARGVGLRLVPDWPLSHWRQSGAPAEQTDGSPVPLPRLGGMLGHHEPAPVAELDGLPLGRDSLLACAWGRPSEAFGPMYARFDRHRKVARLPGPPYHFMSRIAAVHGTPGGMETGSWVEAEYDVPDEVWYREQNAGKTMPLAVLMEVALQPCGWLASYVGSALTADHDLLFRNLDGEGTVHAEVRPGVRTLRTRAEITRIDRGTGMIIEAFDVHCSADGVPVWTLSTVFGYFPASAFDDQPGLPPAEDEGPSMTAPGPGAVDLTARPTRYFTGSARLPGPMLLMLDRITAHWPDGGPAGLGRLRAEKDIDPGEWFFRAHFFQDPVQPGSLGIEAMAQLLQFHMLERGMGRNLRNPRFEPVASGSALLWKYRGQVTPANHLVSVEMDVLEAGEDEIGPFAVARASLRVDGKRIYRADRLAMRMVGDDDTTAPEPRAAVLPSDPLRRVLDPAADRWLLDHRPTWSLPALPMMSTVELLAEAVARHTGRPVTGLRDVTLHRWVTLAGPVELTCELRPGAPGTSDFEVTLLAWREARTSALSRFEPVATGTVSLGTPPPAPSTANTPADAAEDAAEVPDPYTEGALFHGPAFHYLTALRLGPAGSSATLDAGRGTVPPGILNQGLLDAATHVIPHDRLWLWSSRVPRAVVGYPHRLVSLDLYEPLPRAGEVTVQARFVGFDDDSDADDPTYPVIDLQLNHLGRVVATLRLVEILLPQGPFGEAEPSDRLSFLRDHSYAKGLGLSTTRDGVTRLTADEVRRLDWLPGTVAHAYGLRAGEAGTDHLLEIAVRDHVARLVSVHPAQVEVDSGVTTAWPAGRPDQARRVVAERNGDEVAVRSAPSGPLPQRQSAEEE